LQHILKNDMENFFLKVVSFMFFDRKIFKNRQDLAELAMGIFFIIVVFGIMLGGTQLLVWFYT